MSRKPKGYWQDIDNLIFHLQPLCKKYGRLPNQKEFKLENKEALATYVTRFHSWDKVSEILGYEVNGKKIKNWNKEGIIKTYLELLKDNLKDTHFTRKELIDLNRSDLTNAIRRHFETFEQFKEYLKLNDYVHFKNKKEILYSSNPDLVAQWSDKNHISIFSCEPYNKRNIYFWECSKGHEWESNISNRIKSGGRGIKQCPYCSGRRIPKNESLGHLMPDFIEFWDTEKNTKNLVYEVRPTYAVPVWWICKNNHSFKRSPAIATKNKTIECPKCDSLSLSVPNLMKEWDYERNKLDPSKLSIGSGKRVFWKCEKGHSWDTTVSARVGHRSGCPYCAGQRVLPETSLRKKRPDLAKEWNYQKNGDLSPDDVMPNTNKKVWWLCPEKNHEYQATVNNRNYGKNCPFCANVKVGYGNSLADLSPELLKEFDFIKNKNISPENILNTSNKKILWLCDKGHSWGTQVQLRTRNKSGCPYCSNHLASPENNFAVNHPELLKIYDYEKNGNVKPKDFPSGSGTEVWWKCENKHSWKAPFSRIALGSRCSKCSMQTSFPEIRLYSEVKAIFFDAQWRHKIDKDLEIDVFIPSHSICLEYDGKYFHNDENHDINKNNKLIENGMCVIRIREQPLEKINSDDIIITKKVKKDLDKFYIDQSLKTIRHKCSEKEKITIKKYLQNKNYINDNEFKRITSFLPKPTPEKNLGAVNKVLSSEWNYEKNAPLTPEMFEPRSGKKVWWICKYKHEWDATIDHRAKGRNCPYCANRKTGYGNTLKDMSPEIAKEWVIELNDYLKTSEIRNGSGMKAWWICKNNHFYKKRVVDRTTPRKGRYNGCPHCPARGRNRKYNPPENVKEFARSKGYL